MVGDVVTETQRCLVAQSRGRPRRRCLVPPVSADGSSDHAGLSRVEKFVRDRVVPVVKVCFHGCIHHDCRSRWCQATPGEDAFRAWRGGVEVGVDVNRKGPGLARKPDGGDRQFALVPGNDCLGAHLVRNIHRLGVKRGRTPHDRAITGQHRRRCPACGSCADALTSRVVDRGDCLCCRRRGERGHNGDGRCGRYETQFPCAHGCLLEIPEQYRRKVNVRCSLGDSGPDERSLAGASLGQHVDVLGDPGLSRLGLLRRINSVDEPSLIAVRE